MSSQAKDSEARDLFIELARQWQELALQKEEREKNWSWAVSVFKVARYRSILTPNRRSGYRAAANASASAGGTKLSTRRADKMTEYPGFWWTIGA